MNALAMQGKVETTESLELLTAVAVCQQQEANDCPVLKRGLPGGLLVFEELAECTRC